MPGKKGRSTAKRFINDPEFYQKMRRACRSMKESGLCVILQHTGMHRSSLNELTMDSLRVEGGNYYLDWEAPKWQRHVRKLFAHIPFDDYEIVAEWIRKWSNRHPDRYRAWIREIGERAGFPEISPMTYRVQRIVLLMRATKDTRKVSIITGATPDVIWRHYAQASEKEASELMRDMIQEDITSADPIKSTDYPQ